MEKQISANTVNQKGESLPFTVQYATSKEALEAAVKIRHAAYARHLPDVAQTLSEAESWDNRDGAVIIVARSKLDDEPLGTMRIHTNLFEPLPLEQSVKLPARFEGKRLAEATRLGIATGSVGSVVKHALFKAYFLYCQRLDIDRMVITARMPLDRMYERLLFTDIEEHRKFVPMNHVGGLPHRVMEFGVREAPALWASVRHPLLGFVYETLHSDILPDESAAPPSVTAHGDIAVSKQAA